MNKDNCKSCCEEIFNTCTCDSNPKIAVVGPGKNSEIHDALMKTKHHNNVIMESREDFIERKSIEMMPLIPFVKYELPELYITEGKRRIKNKSKKVRNIKKNKKLSRRNNRK